MFHASLWIGHASALAYCGTRGKEAMRTPEKVVRIVQDPTCAKVSISGRMRIVPGDAVAEAEQLLFRRHPQMKTWPVSCFSSTRYVITGISVCQRRVEPGY